MRIAREGRYVMMLIDAVEDSRLSFLARGVLMYMAGKPDDWQFSVPRMARDGLESEGKIRRAIQELIHYGYLERYPDQHRGRFRGYRYVIHATSSGAPATYPSRKNEYADN